MNPDVIVVGGGIVGLTTAAALEKRGITVTLVSEERSGAASPAAAGMLAPCVEKSDGAAHTFAVAARDRYPAYVEELESRTGARVELNRAGVLQVALTETEAELLRTNADDSALWVEASQLSELEPLLRTAHGALLHACDGYVDNVALIAALMALLSSSSHVTRVNGHVTKIAGRSDGDAVVQLASGETMSASTVVIAAGAWAPLIRGFPCLHFVTPARGQLISFESVQLGHVVYGADGYLVPRRSAVVIAGSTMENAGYDARTTTEGMTAIHSSAARLVPQLSSAHIAASWAGLRPVTPDMLPLLGRNTDAPAVICACGHSRNGILLAPLTADVVAQLVVDEPVGYDVAQFHPDRF